jgi:ribosomal protein S27E
LSQEFRSQDGLLPAEKSMAFEVSCSQCQGRLMVEQAGQVVACPHCGTHLAIPDAAPSDAATVDSVPDDEPATAAAEIPSDPAPAENEAASAENTVPEAAAEIQPDSPLVFENPAFAQETQDEIPVFNPAPEEATQNEPAVETIAAPDSVADQSADAGDEEVSVSPDNPFAGGSPDFGVGFGSAPAEENPFSGGDFNFGEADAGSVTTVSEFVPAPAPDDGSESAEAAPLDAATDPADAQEQPAEAPQPTAETSPVPEAAPGLGTFTAEASEDAAGVAGQLTPDENGTISAVDSVPEPVGTSPVEQPQTAAYQPPAAASPDTVPRSKYVLVLSWASAATIAALFLAYVLTTSQTSQLESLPDVKPPKKDDEIVYKLVPENAPMPPGHVLALGETQRYGNLKVTATRVTRGPVQFEHYDANSNRTKDDGPEVLKLWLKFENVSSDQSIAPLDELVFQRDDRDFENVRANIFLARASQKLKTGTRLMVYDLNTSGDWNLKAQQVEHEIPPGGQLETYIPTTPEGIGDVLGSDEELVWRVHFRKGYSPKNYGVTTVVEVSFSESDIESDSTVPAAPAPADIEDNASKA